MSLTGPLLIWVLWIASAALFGWIIYAWPKSAGTSVGAVLTRVGYQLAVLVLVLLAVFVSLNDANDWYSSWEDLTNSFGTEAPPAGQLVTGGGAAQAAAAAAPTASNDPLVKPVPVNVLPSAAALGLSANPGPDGQYKTFALRGPKANQTNDVTVWFPTSYTSAAAATRTYPVIEAFHGWPGSPRQFVTSFAIGRLMTQEANSGRIAESIIVMPTIAPHGIDTECVNGGPGAIQMETWLTDTVTKWIRTHLRVNDSRGAWATLGYSAGAYCASMMAMLHPDRFSAAVSLGGYFQPTFEKSYDPFPPNSALARQYDLVALARSDNPPPIALWVETSPVDPMSYNTTQQVVADARPPMSVTADVLKDAGHRFGVWVPLVAASFNWLGQVAPGFRPTAPS